jgi:hypothetical protein
MLRRVIATLCGAAVVFSAGAGSAVNQFSESFNNTTYKDAVHTTADWNTGAGQLRMYPFVPSLVGAYNTSGNALGVDVAGDFAFVADNYSGLQIINIANPASPTLLGTYNTPGQAMDVAVAGDLAFVADYTSGLQIINITIPATPTLVGSYDTPSFALGVAVAGDLAFLTDYTNGVRIINIANPANPTLVSTYDTPSYAYGVAVAGDLLFIADSGYGLEIISIANPASPTLVGSSTAVPYAIDVAVDGNLAFVTDDASGLRIIDITNPAHPTLVSTFDTPGNARGIAVSGDVAYVADETAGLEMIDISNPVSPALVGSYNTPGSAYGVAVSGDMAFVADDASGLQVVRVSHPVTNPALLGVLEGDAPRGVAVSGDLVFEVEQFPIGFQIISIANPANPTLVGIANPPGTANAVAVSGDLAFLAADDGLYVVDISNPASPTLTGSYHTPAYDSFYGVAVAGDLAFVAEGFSAALQIINISNPASPTLTGSYHAPGAVVGVAVAGDLAFVAGGQSGLLIINISNPASPTLTGSYNTPGDATGVAVAGDLAFVADYTAGLQIINISNPVFPTLVGTYDTPGGAMDLAVAGDFAFVADYMSGLQVISIVNPATPTLVGTYASGIAMDVAVAGDLAFVPGLEVIQVFQHEVDPSRNMGRSLAVDGSADVIRRARLSTTQTAGVSWEVSGNGGGMWQAITPNNAWSPIAIPGSDLLWRSTHTWSRGANAAVSDLHLDWLYDYAAIDAITDIANDQGRQVRIEWTRSSHDFVGDPTQVVEYAVYRKIDPGLGEAAIPASTFDHLSPAAKENALMMLAAGWDFIMTVPVLAEDYYGVVVPTLKDSTVVAGLYRTTFRVTALTATPGVFFHSPPDSGYSVDNLAPHVPANFAVAYNSGGGNTLAWDASPDADFQYFRVYRSSNPSFTPSAGTLVHSAISHGWVDLNHRGGGVYYKVTALDFSGNESGPASAGTITAVGGPALPTTFALYPNVPNPFNPTTLIRYDVPESGGEVSLTIYDVSGRVVKTLVSGVQSAGEKSVAWNGRDDTGQAVASGVYFYRLVAPAYTKTHKMVLMK